MEIYLAEQVSWNDSTMTDFELPKRLGYFKTKHGAEQAINKHMKSMLVTESDFVTRNDYYVANIEVQD